MEYDAIVIGAGAGGLVAAKGAAGLGKRALLVERDRIGGDCTHTGCVPSKALVSVARRAHAIKTAGEEALSVKGATINWKKIREHLDEKIAQIAKNTSPEALADAGVDFARADAQLLDHHTVQVGEETHHADHIVISTGARPRIPDIPGLQDADYDTNHTIFTRDKMPKTLAIIGGGPIAAELGQAFARLGSEVHVIERENRILRKESPDVSAYIQDVLEEDGVRFHLRTTVNSVKAKKTVTRVKLSSGDAISADAILLSAGRVANLPRGLKDAGVRVDDAGRIKTGKDMRTTRSNIYACGDCTSPLMFSHLAEHQARLIIQNAFVPFVRKTREEKAVPWATFTDPEVAHVGLTHEQLERKKSVTYRADLADNDRAITESAPEGFVKIHATPIRGKILSATVVAEDAGEIINALTLAIQEGTPVRKLSKLIMPYPTRSQSVRNAADKYYKETLAGLFKKLFS